MIYLYQNNEEYDYDVRAIALAFFEREKIVAVSEEDMAQRERETEGEDSVRFLSLIYAQGRIDGRLWDHSGRQSEQSICCDYKDHGRCRNDVSRYDEFSVRLRSAFDDDFADILALSQIILDFLREDILTVFRNDDILFSSGDKQESPVIDIAVISCIEPAVLQDFRSLFRILVISQHDGIALRYDFSDAIFIRIFNADQRIRHSRAD